VRKTPFAFTVAACLAGLAGCPGPNDQNPPQLWLAPDNAETAVKLIDHEPDPF
jgi:hypothetical protein